MTIEMAPAGPAELDEVAVVLGEAVDWLVARGMPMWRHEEVGPAQLRDAVAAGEFWLARRDGEVLGTVRLTRYDPLFWPELAAGQALFVHRLAVRRQAARQGVAAALLGLAAQQAARLGCTDLRLDCAADRPGLRAYYERSGFRFHSLHQAGPWLVARYWRPLAA